MAESPAYRHLWTCPASDAILGEPARVRAWVGILAALAQAQGELRIVDPAVAVALAELDTEALDLDEIGAQTRATSHSTLGLIRVLQRALPADVGEWVYYGATVQDVSDTWFGLVMRDVGDAVLDGVRRVRASAVALAVAHRDTAMAGRTHGQAGAPTSFGLKAASWADELLRHEERLEQGRNRWAVGQLAGAVGALGFFGADGTALRARFCELLGLGDPGVSWCASRDRVAEFGQVLASVCGTLARIGGEVLELQRPEIDELREPASPTGVGSITMPHKRNPEVSEHLDTLSRLVRAQTGVLLEGLSGMHERDGRSWKAEWVALPEVAILTLTALSLADPMVAGLEVDAESMRRNLDARGPAVGSERLLAELSRRLGKQRAQAALQDLWHDEAGRSRRLTADQVAARVAGLGDVDASVEQVRAWLDGEALAGAGPMVDAVVRRAGLASVGVG